VNFERWALAITDVLEDKLGARNVRSEVYEDHAIWATRANRCVARPERDGKAATVVFDKGLGHRVDLDADPDAAGAGIVGRLLGL